MIPAITCWLLCCMLSIFYASHSFSCNRIMYCTLLFRAKTVTAILNDLGIFWGICSLHKSVFLIIFYLIITLLLYICSVNYVRISQGSQITGGIWCHHFQRTRSTFEYVLEQIMNKLNNAQAGQKAITAEKQLAILCRYLGSRDTIIQLSHLFDVTDSSIVRVRHKVFSALLDCLLECKTTWPEPLQLQHISEAFNIMGDNRFPGVVGCIDGIHIPICKPPGADERNYFNRKQLHSVILQGTCRENLYFIGISVGCPGCMHNANVFHKSSMYNRGLDLTGNGGFHTL